MLIHDSSLESWMLKARPSKLCTFSHGSAEEGEKRVLVQTDSRRPERRAGGGCGMRWERKEVGWNKKMGR